MEAHASSFVLKQSWLVDACTGQPAGVPGGIPGGGASAVPEFAALGGVCGDATGGFEGVALHALAKTSNIQVPTTRPHERWTVIRSTSCGRRRRHRCGRTSIPRRRPLESRFPST